VASSSNTTWAKGFSGNPNGQDAGGAGEEKSFAELVSGIGGERVAYPVGGEDALAMLRREALARTLWTRAVIDGDMTAIKLLVELLEGKGAGNEGGVPQLNADQWAAAERAFKAWMAEHGVAENPAAPGEPEKTMEAGDDGR
jgi:hypothetical protein